MTLWGKPVSLAHIRDVTECCRASDVFKDSEIRFYAIFDNANDAIFLVEGYAYGMQPEGA